MSPRAVRLVVLAVCAAGIAGMVVGSVADDNTVALTFGLITAAAVACLIVATAVGGPDASEADEVGGERIEELVAALVARGAEEATVRDLVGEAVRLGRSRRNHRDEKAGAGVHGGRTPRPDGGTFT